MIYRSLKVECEQIKNNCFIGCNRYGAKFSNSAPFLSLKNKKVVMNVFETVSFHIVKPCNMKCKFCYATFGDMHVKQLSVYDAKIIIEKLFNAGVQKITFAGGEPLLYKGLNDCVVYAKSLGMTTSIITNGSLLTDEWLDIMKPVLDWIGVSVDSVYKITNKLIGRTYGFNVDYYALVSKIKSYGYRLKINTVVNAYNQDEDLNEFISFANPDRWKVFQTLKVEGQNDKQFEQIKCTQKEFEDFIDRHSSQLAIVPENNEAMTGSYLLIDPQGRLFENSKGRHTYSSPLQDNTIDKCLSEIEINRDTFIKRGGLYEW